LKTTDAGINCDYILVNNYSYRPNAVCFTSSDTGFVIGNESMIYKTVNAGNSWVEMNAGTTDALIDIFFINPTTGYAVGIFFHVDMLAP